MLPVYLAFIGLLILYFRRLAKNWNAIIGEFERMVANSRPSGQYGGETTAQLEKRLARCERHLRFMQLIGLHWIWPVKN